MPWQPAALLHTDIEAWGVTFLTAALAARSESYKSGVVVSNAVPDPRPARLVTVRRDGGVPVGVLDKPRLNVGIWAMTEEDVADLTRLVSALIAGARTAPITNAVMVGGPVAVPDPSGQPRKSMTWELTTKGTALT